MFYPWHIVAQLRKNSVSISYPELVLGNALLIGGGWALGFGTTLAEIINVAVGFLGGAAVVAGIIMAAKSGSKVAKALNNANTSLVEVTKQLENVSSHTLRSIESKTSSGAPLERQFFEFKKKVENDFADLRRLCKK